MDVNLVSSAGDEAATWLRPTGEGIAMEPANHENQWEVSWSPWVIRAWGSVEEAVGVEIVAPFILRVVQTI